MPAPSILLVSPVRNEAAHIERVAHAVGAQMLPPRRWLVLDDGSDDGTSELLEGLRDEIPFMEVLAAPPLAEIAAARDRLAAAVAPRLFNHALARVDVRAYDYVGKLDGDVELPPDYLERLMERFATDPALGIACGDLVEQRGADWRRIPIPGHHVHGALKLYRRDCFATIGGIRETLGWDTIDEASARAAGYRTRSFRDIEARHHRPWGSADGTLRGRARHGVAAWILGYGAGFALLRSLKLATVRPVVLSGACFFFGYMAAAVRRTPRAEPEFRRYMRSELRARLRPRFATSR